MVEPISLLHTDSKEDPVLWLELSSDGDSWSRFRASTIVLGSIILADTVAPRRTLALGFELHLPALTLELLGEEVVEYRTDHHDGRQQLNFLKGRGDCGGEYVGPQLKVQPQRQVGSQVQPDLGVRVLPQLQKRQGVTEGG